MVKTKKAAAKIGDKVIRLEPHEGTGRIIMLGMAVAGVRWHDGETSKVKIKALNRSGRFWVLKGRYNWV